MKLINIDGFLTPAGLRCEYRQVPLGIDETKPRLSWRLESSDPAARGLRQTAYQLLVASSRQALDNDQGDLWDSGRISGQANRCAYAGKPLTSRLACHWKVAIPPNTTATLHLPTEKPDAITESGQPLSGARGVKLLGAVEGAVSLALESGAYAFAW